MKKTLLVTLEYPPFIGGVANHLASLAENFDPNKIVVLADNYPDSKSFDSQQKYKIIRKKLLFKLIRPRWLLMYFVVKKIVRRYNIEQILVGQILPVGKIASMLKLPYIIMTYAMDVTILGAVDRKKKMAQNIIDQAKYIVTISDFTKNQLIKLGTDEEKVKLVYPCPTLKSTDINDQKLAEVKNKYNPNNKKIILTTGRLVQRKGQDMVIKAMKKVIEQENDVLYLIGGKGEYEKKLKDLVKERSLEDYVKFIGFFSEEELPYLYAMSDVFIMASRQLEDQDVEGFGIVFLEANMFEKPVIGGNSGGIPSAVEDNVSGLLVDPTSIDEISDAIIKLLTDPELAQRLGQQGKQRVLNEFRWDIQTKKLEGYLE